MSRHARGCDITQYGETIDVGSTGVATVGCTCINFTQRDVAILRALAGLEEAALIRTMITFPSETICGAVRSIADRIEAGLS